MTPPNDISRRTALKLAGAAAATAVVAGCSSADDIDDDGATNGNGNGNGNGFEIEPGTRILLEGNTGGYEGIEPDEIAGEVNPTLVLEDGEEYEIGWTQGDGGSHNVVLWDSGETMVEDYGTTLRNDPGDADTFTFTATDEIAYYRCEPHADMQGEIDVQ